MALYDDWQPTISGRLKQFLGWARHYGWSNAIYKHRVQKQNQDRNLDPEHMTGRQISRLHRRTDRGCPRVVILHGFTEIPEAQYYILTDQEQKIFSETVSIIALYLNTQPADLIYWDERDADGTALYKPDWAPETYEENPYIGNCFTVSKEILQQMLEGLSASVYQNHVLVGQKMEDHAWRAVMLQIQRQAVEKSNRILHIPLILSERLEKQTTDLQQIHQTHQKWLMCWMRQYSQWNGNLFPKVSILIPNKDHADDLRRCLASIFTRTSYPSYEVIVIENNSEEKETFDAYHQIEEWARREGMDLRILRCETDWNYSYINNYGRHYISDTSNYLLLLNNDTEVINPTWLTEMVYYGIRDEIGAVGAKLYYPDGTIQHGGVTLGIREAAGHSFHGFPHDAAGYMNRLQTPQNVSAVTAACMLLPVKIFDEAGGFDEKLKVAFNDIDLCLRIRQMGYRIVWTPYAELTHYESKSRGEDAQSGEKQKRFAEEFARFQRKWVRVLTDGDPYYSPHLSLKDESFREL